MALRMTDRDILERIVILFGGAIYEDRSKKKETHKDIWHWQLGTQAEIDKVITLIYPYMGIRRQAKMDEFKNYYYPESIHDLPTRSVIGRFQAQVA